MGVCSALVLFYLGVRWLYLHWKAKQEQIHSWLWGPHIHSVHVAEFSSLGPCLNCLEHRNYPPGVPF